MSLGQAFRVYNLVLLPFFFSFHFQYAEKDVVSQFPAPAARPATYCHAFSTVADSLWNSKSIEMLPSISFFGHGIIITGRGLQRKRRCYYDLDFK